MKITWTFRSLFFLGALLSLVFFLGTYVLQYGFNVEPCPLCYLQRFVLLIISLVFWLGVIQNCKHDGRLVYCAVGFIFSLLGSVLALRQLWLQYMPPVHESSCLAGFTTMLEFMPLWEVLTETLQGTQECSKIDFTFLGLSLPGWSLLNFMGFGVYILILCWLQIKRRI